MSNHWLIVEQDDDDGYSLSAYCDGADSSCLGWKECREEHPDLDWEVESEGVSHGVEHSYIVGMWMVETGRCSLYAFPEAWQDAGDDLASELGEGRHPIWFEWEDEYTINLGSAT